MYIRCFDSLVRFKALLYRCKVEKCAVDVLRVFIVHMFTIVAIAAVILLRIEKYTVDDC